MFVPGELKRPPVILQNSSAEPGDFRNEFDLRFLPATVFFVASDLRNLLFRAIFTPSIFLLLFSFLIEEPREKLELQREP